MSSSNWLAKSRKCCTVDRMSVNNSTAVGLGDIEFVVRAGNESYNVVTVKDGKIGVTEATCPDHYCMNRGFCSSGTQIVCLPNRLVIRFVGEQEIDGVSG